MGVNVIGLDNSRFLLDEAKNNVDVTEPRIQFIEADMRRIPLKPSCDAVISLFTSFGFFEETDNKIVLSGNRLRAQDPAVNSSLITGIHTQ